MISDRDLIDIYSIENTQTPEKPEFQKAYERLPEKNLWLIPDWECDRFPGKVCAICFASDAMRQVKERGYDRSPREVIENNPSIKGYLETLKAVSELPWKEVIITGGEPTRLPEILGVALETINEDHDVRIITNGDWLLREKKRERVFLALSKRPQTEGTRLRVDISDHEGLERLEEKIAILRTCPVPIEIGVQLRDEEAIPLDTEESYEQFISRAQHNGLFTEQHSALALGMGKENDSFKTMDLQMLVKYGKPETNIGFYLTRQAGGAKGTTHHETVYLTRSTAADLVSPFDGPVDAVNAILDYYNDPDVSKETPLFKTAWVSYARACYESNIPFKVDSRTLADIRSQSFLYETQPEGDVDFTGEFAKQTLVFVEGCKDFICERNSLTKDQLNDLILKNIAARISHFSSTITTIGDQDPFMFTEDLLNIGLIPTTDAQEFAASLAVLLVPGQYVSTFDSREQEAFYKEQTTKTTNLVEQPLVADIHERYAIWAKRHPSALKMAGIDIYSN